VRVQHHRQAGAPTGAPPFTFAGSYVRVVLWLHRVTIRRHQRIIRRHEALVVRAYDRLVAAERRAGW